MTPPEPDKPFTPAGQPLSKEELLKLSSITPTDLEQAIADAHQSLKPFLLPQRKRFGGQQ